MEFLTATPKPRKFFRTPDGDYFDLDALVAISLDWRNVTIYLLGGHSLVYEADSKEEAEKCRDEIINIAVND